MNKSEIIRKTALIAGAPEADASLFFEIFIRSAADILNPGDIIEIKDLGFLHYKMGRADEYDVKEARQIFPGSGWVDLVVYSDSAEKINSEDPVYFIVPAKYEYDFAEIDAPFSLSFSKPVIQLLRKKDSYYIPQSYNELIRLFESKAARLLVNAKVIKNEKKENEVFNPGIVTAEEEKMSFIQDEKEVISGEKKETDENFLSPDTQKEFDELTEALETAVKEDEIKPVHEPELKETDEQGKTAIDVQDQEIKAEKSDDEEKKLIHAEEEPSPISDEEKTEEIAEEEKVITGDEVNQVKEEPWSFAENKAEGTSLSEEIPGEQPDQLKEELSEPADEEKKEETALQEPEFPDQKFGELNEETETLLKDAKEEETFKDAEQVDKFSDQSGRPGVEPPAESETEKEEATGNEKPDEEKEIDKLLSKASFGANIPWKFNDVNIIEPGKEKPEEPPEEEIPEGEDVSAGTKESLHDQTDADNLGVKHEDETVSLGEKKSEDQIKDSEHVSWPPEAEDVLDTYRDVYDQSLSLGETTEVPEQEPEKETPDEEDLQKISIKDENSNELPIVEPPVIRPEHEEYTETENEEELRTEESKGFTKAYSDESAVGPEKRNDLSQMDYDHDEIYGKQAEENPSEVSGEEDYEEVKPVKLRYDWKEGYLQDSDKPSIPEESEEEKTEEPVHPDDEGYIEIKPGGSKEKIDFLADSEEEGKPAALNEESVSGEDRAQKDLKEYISKIEEIDKETSHKRKSTTVLTLIIFFLFVGVGVYLYYQYIFNKDTKTAGKTQTVVVKNPETIERDFLIPVTYPYSKNENKENLYTQPIDSSIFAVSGAGITSIPKTEAPKAETKTAEPPPLPKLENLGDYIYRLGNDYIVQIASFNTQTRAEAQVESLKKANYDAYSELVSRSDGTGYYRVMIRGFKTYEQAKTFLK